MARRMGRPKKTTETIQIGIVLPRDISDEVVARSTKDGLTRAGWIRRAVYRQLAAEDATKAA